MDGQDSPEDQGCGCYKCKTFDSLYMALGNTPMDFAQWKRAPVADADAEIDSQSPEQRLRETGDPRWGRPSAAEESPLYMVVQMWQFFSMAADDTAEKTSEDAASGPSGSTRVDTPNEAQASTTGNDIGSKCCNCCRCCSCQHCSSCNHCSSCHHCCSCCRSLKCCH